MKFGLLGLVVGCVLIGCGGASDGHHVVSIGITNYSQNFGVSVEAWKDGETTSDECRDDKSAPWCDRTADGGLKEVRFWSDDTSTSYDYYDLFMKNSDSVVGTVRLQVATGGYSVVDRDVTLNPGQKIRIGSVNRRGDFFGVNGF
ncbi:MAG: hypothetical protein ACKVQS_11405 [Fimbriimonadaceae bacterium]